MDIIQIVRIMTDCTYSGINFTSRLRYLVDAVKYKKIIAKNVELKNKFSGDTCYILGNGPSIKQLDINLIRNKKVFVVNGFYKSPLYEQLAPTVHCIYDKFIFEESREDIDPIISENKHNTIFILNRRAIGKLSNPQNCYYVYSTLLPTKHCKSYELTKNANTWLNIIPFAIMCAIYMGFKKIILLGCDFSLFASRKQSHFYDQSASIDRKESLFQDLQGNAIVCTQHDYLRVYAEKNGITIVNATPGSLLDVYPQVNLQDYLD